MNAKPTSESGLIPPSSPPPAIAPPPPTMMHDTLVTAPPTPSSFASLFLHPASLAASLAGYPPHPWTISWMNAAAGYGFVNAASSAAMDLTTVAAVHHRNPLSSIADLRLKAKRHAEELVDVSSSGNNNNINNNENDEQPNSPL